MNERRFNTEYSTARASPPRGGRECRASGEMGDRDGTQARRRFRALLRPGGYLLAGAALADVRPSASAYACKVSCSSSTRSINASYDER